MSVSCISFIELLVLPVCSFCHCKCKCSSASLWTVLRVVYDPSLCGFILAKALNLGLLPITVHQSPRCGRHCYYLNTANM